jgi:outer membrane protein TolC
VYVIKGQDSALNSRWKQSIYSSIIPNSDDSHDFVASAKSCFKVAATIGLAVGVLCTSSVHAQHSQNSQIAQPPSNTQATQSPQTPQNKTTTQSVTLHDQPAAQQTTPVSKTPVVGVETVDPNTAWDAAIGADAKKIFAQIGPGASPTENNYQVLSKAAKALNSRRLAQANRPPAPAPTSIGDNTVGGTPGPNAATQDPAAPAGQQLQVPTAPSIDDPNRGVLSSPPTAGGQPAGIGTTSSPNKAATGEAAKPSILPTAQFSQDKAIFDKENEEWRQRYLIGEAIELSLPQPNQLMSLGSALPPIRLEANYTQPISLKDSLMYSLDNNLAIRIANSNKSAQKWLAVGQFGGFLPNMIMNFQHQFLKGSTVIGGIIPTTFDTPNTSVQAGFQYFGFQGGAVLFGSLAQLHQFRASREQLHGTVNDTLLAVTRGYYSLVQNQALLQIQTRAVEVSRAQVLLNQQLEQAGTGTKFQVLQSDTQLARDEQNLLGQEVSLRNSAIDLATTLNLNAAVNFLSVETEIRKVRLIDPTLDINTLVALAVLNRPELRQYEQLRVAARRNIQVAAAPLYPQMQFFGSVNGNGATLGHSQVLTKPSFTTVAVAAPSPSSTIISPNAGVTSANGTMVATGNVQSITGFPGIGTSNTTPLVASASQYNPPTLESRQMKESYTIGLRVDWNYPGLGVPTASNVWAAKALARQALLNSNQQLLNVLQQVRESYLLSQTAEREIEVTTKAVISAAEELRLSRVRLANGVGTNIDVINSQRDFTTALVNKAQAIIQFNVAQAQLLHDIGLITVDTLTSGRLVKRDST